MRNIAILPGLLVVTSLASYRFKMASKRSEYVLDELVCFLSNPLFQVPVLSFMESKCLSKCEGINVSDGQKPIFCFGLPGFRYRNLGLAQIESSSCLSPY